MDIAVWLQGLGLGEHAERFRAAAIGLEELGSLTAEHLKQLGIPPGHRIRLVKAIADQGPAQSSREVSPLRRAFSCCPSPLARIFAIRRLTAGKVCFGSNVTVDFGKGVLKR